jgi:hypothetical protein
MLVALAPRSRTSSAVLAIMRSRAAGSFRRFAGISLCIMS